MKTNETHVRGEAKDLIPKGLTLQSELNEFEERNIAEGSSWAFGRKRKNWLSIGFVLELHRRMFGNIWRWAGQFRKTNKNIGVDKLQIREELSKLCLDVQYWIDHQTFDWNEIAARFHHRLVRIHLFPNGNGRHARIMADIVLYQNG